MRGRSGTSRLRPQVPDQQVLSLLAHVPPCSALPGGHPSVQGHWGPLVMRNNPVSMCRRPAGSPSSPRWQNPLGSFRPSLPPFCSRLGEWGTCPAGLAKILSSCLCESTQCSRCLPVGALGPAPRPRRPGRARGRVSTRFHQAGQLEEWAGRGPGVRATRQGESRARGRRRAGGPPLPLWHEGLSHRPWVPAPRDQVRRRALWASWAMGGCREARPGPRKCRWSTEGSRARERAGGHTLLIRQDEVSGARAPLPTGLWGVGWGAWPPGSSVWGGSALGPCPRPGRPGPAHP